jgi:hypothetical protein
MQFSDRVPQKEVPQEQYENNQGPATLITSPVPTS